VIEWLILCAVLGVVALAREGWKRHMLRPYEPQVRQGAATGLWYVAIWRKEGVMWPPAAYEIHERVHRQSKALAADHRYCLVARLEESMDEDALAEATSKAKHLAEDWTKHPHRTIEQRALRLLES
jgi:hypothetical protein